MDIKKTDASTIYTTLVDFLQQKNIPLSKLVGTGGNILWKDLSSE